MPLEVSLRRLGPTGLLNRWLTSDSSPTSDLYFANACQEILTEGLVTQYSPTVFASASTQLVMRHDARTPAHLTRDCLVYFIDDLWNFRDEDPGLSWFYRNKMALVEARAVDWYLKRANAFVVSTPLLADDLRKMSPQADVYLINPYWSEPVADLDHFDRHSFDIAYLGGQVHRADLEFLLPAIRRVLDEIPEASFTLSVGHRIPSDLETHPRVHRLQALRWRDYRRSLPKKRFHLALYPLLDTPFNRARSINKIIEHAVTGAVGLYSDWWVENLPKAFATNALNVPNNFDMWADKIIHCYENRQDVKIKAKALSETIKSLPYKKVQIDLWTKLMKI